MELKNRSWCLVVVLVLVFVLAFVPKSAAAFPLEIVFYFLPPCFEAASAGQSRNPVESAVLVGRVLDEAGAPLTGARVRVREPGAQEMLEKTTPADGKFRFQDIPSGKALELWAEHQNAQTAVLLVKPGEESEIVLVLEAGSRIAGRVVAGDNVVVDALVLVLSEGHTRGSAQSDAEGRFRIQGLKPGLLELRAISPGLTGEPLVFELVAGESAEDLEIELSAGAIVEGKVRSAHGEPLAGVVVERVAEDRDLVARLAAAKTRTDEEGFYRLTGLPNGPVRLRARRADLIGAEQELELKAEGNGLDWQLEAGVRVAGRIETSEGRPVAGAAISAFDAQGRCIVDGVVSAGDGSFELEGLPAGPLRVVGEPPTAARTEKVVLVAAGEDPPSIVLRCPPPASLAGRLFGAPAEVLAKAEVWALGPQGEQRMGQLTGEAGYHIPALAPGPWRVTIRVPGWPREVIREKHLEAGEAATIDIDLGLAGFRLRGQVVQDGEPVAGLVVAATSSGTVSSGAVTDRQGAFEIEALPAGVYQITLLGRKTSHSRTIELRNDLQLEFDLTVQEKEPSNDASTEEIR